MRYTIRFKIAILFFLTITLFFLIFGVIYYSIVKKQTLETAKTEFDASTNSVMGIIDSQLKVLDEYHYLFYTDIEFMSSLKNIKPIDQRDNYSQYKMQQIIYKYLSEFSNSNNYIDSLSLYSVNGETYFSTKRVFSMVHNIKEDNCSHIKAYQAAKGNQWSLYDEDIYEGRMLLFFQPLYDFETDEYLGLVSINLNASRIEEYLYSIQLKQNGYVFAVDALGNPLAYQGDKALLEKIRTFDFTSDQQFYVDNSDYIVTRNTSAYTGWQYYSVTPTSDVMIFSDFIKNILYISYIAMLLIFLINAFIAFSFFYQPLINVFKAMKRVQNGDLSVSIDIRRKDEVGFINHQFNNMVSNLNKLIKEQYVNDLLLQQAQLINIHSQINKHFLYNTLDSIRWSAKDSENASLEKAILTLSKFYRLSLSSGNDIISIREAGSMIRCYLELEKIRLGDLLAYSIDIDEALLDNGILKYILQPLVENCIVHGIHPKDSGGNIHVRIDKDNGKISISITDNGVGIPKEKLEKIIQSIEGDYTQKREYFAIQTVNLLLKSYYGDESALKISINKHGGTTVCFNIPYQKEAG